VGVTRQLAGQALRYNLLLFAEKANNKRIFTSILNANDLLIALRLNANFV